MSRRQLLLTLRWWRSVTFLSWTEYRIRGSSNLDQRRGFSWNALKIRKGMESGFRARERRWFRGIWNLWMWFHYGATLFWKIFFPINDESRKEVDTRNNLNNTENDAEFYTDIDLVTAPGNLAVTDVVEDWEESNEILIISATREHGIPRKVRTSQYGRMSIIPLYQKSKNRLILVFLQRILWIGRYQILNQINGRMPWQVE